MKRKIVAFLMAACMALALTGCGEKNASDEYITISDYGNIEIDEVEKTEVTDQDVEDRLQANLENNMQEVDAAESGDYVTLDYVGKKGALVFDSGEDLYLQIGAGGYVDGFEDGMLGHKKGDSFQLPIKFPDDYGSEELNGADVVFDITVTAVERMPELNDDFVKTVSEKSETVDEYRKEVREDLEKENEETLQTTIGENAWAKLLENNVEVKQYPEDEVESIQSMIRSQYEMWASYYQMEFADFVETQMGMTEDQFDEQARIVAEETVKEKLAIKLLAKKLKLEPSEEEYQKALEEMAEENGYESVEDLAEAVGSEDDLKVLVLRENVIKWFSKHCTQVEVETAAE